MFASRDLGHEVKIQAQAARMNQARITIVTRLNQVRPRLADRLDRDCNENGSGSEYNSYETG